MNFKSTITEAQIKEWLVSYRAILFDAMHCLDTLKVLEKDNEGEQVIARIGFAHMMWNLYQHVMINSLDKLCSNGQHQHLNLSGLCQALHALMNDSWLSERIATAEPGSLRWTSWNDVEVFIAGATKVRKDHRALIKTIHDYRNNVTSHTWASFGGLPRPILKRIEMNEAQELIDQLQICFLEISGGIYGEAHFPNTNSVTLQALIDKARN